MDIKMLSRVGIDVIDAHAHFFTASTLKAWSLRGRTREGFEKRTRSRTDMTSIDLPDESTDVPQMWVDEMDRYKITAMGFMVGEEAYHDFLKAKERFPGRFMGYANINPGDPEAANKVKKAANDGLQGIKLYPSSWSELHTYDAPCYPIYEAALKHKLPIFLHFGITIGGQADLRHGNPLPRLRDDTGLPAAVPAALGRSALRESGVAGARGGHGARLPLEPNALARIAKPPVDVAGPCRDGVGLRRVPCPVSFSLSLRSRALTGDSR